WKRAGVVDVEDLFSLIPRGRWRERPASQVDAGVGLSNHVLDGGALLPDGQRVLEGERFAHSFFSGEATDVDAGFEFEDEQRVRAEIIKEAAHVGVEANQNRSDCNDGSDPYHYADDG